MDFQTEYSEKKWLETFLLELHQEVKFSFHVKMICFSLDRFLIRQIDGSIAV